MKLEKRSKLAYVLHRESRVSSNDFLQVSYQCFSRLMTDPGPDPLYLRVLLHFKDNFLRHLPSFEGETYLVTDRDFSTMDLTTCVECLERFIGEPHEKLFNTNHNRPLETGFWWIELVPRYSE